MSASDDSDHQQRVFKFIEFLTKRLDHTASDTETSTRQIYLVKGTILAAVYFAFGRDWRLWVSLIVTAFLALVLAILNWFHANFLHVQHAWYRTIHEEIRRVFLKFENSADV
jgi:magnesium-transporting ATPase (P-type)